MIEVTAIDLAILLAMLEDHQLESLTPSEEAAIENLRDCLAAQ
jgi:hypothetical protein